jgi:hypothetical protein
MGSGASLRKVTPAEAVEYAEPVQEIGVDSFSREGRPQVSTERQRDAETDQLLRATLQPGVHAEACPGADMLAAYAEGALSPAERDGLEVHFAECHRCQEALAFMARTWTAPDTAHPSPSGRWWHLRLRWLVPVAAAAIVVMYVAVRPVIAPDFPPVDQAAKAGQSPVPEHVMADARSQERGAITAERDAASAGRTSAARTSEAKGADRATEIGAQLPEVGRAEPFATLPKPDIKGAELMGEAGARARMSATSGAGQNTVPKAPDAKGTGPTRETAVRLPGIRGTDLPTPPRKPEGAATSGEKEAGARPQEARRAEQNTQLRVADSQVTVVAEKVEVLPPAESAKSRAAAMNEAQAGALPPAAFAPAPATAPAAPRAAAADAPLQQLVLKTAAAAPRYVTSPDGSVLWRIAPGGRVARSIDGGTTWQGQPIGVSKELLAGSAGGSKELLAGSAPSATVCWIVGRDATIIVTTDGAHWATRPFPERVDLVAVEATDASSAIVTTRDGRRFITRDRGTTWSAIEE